MKTVLVFCIAFGLILLTLQAEAVTLGEGLKVSRVLPDSNLGRKVNVGANDVGLTGNMDNMVAGGDGKEDGQGSSTDTSHRYFTDKGRPGDGGH